jgi:hypothetical protein
MIFFSLASQHILDHFTKFQIKIHTKLHQDLIMNIVAVFVSQNIQLDLIHSSKITKEGPMIF